MEFSIRELLFVWMAAIEKLQRALEPLRYIFLGGQVGRKKFMKIEDGEAPVGDPPGEKLSKLAGFHAAQSTDLLEDDTLQRILKNCGIEQAANLKARATLEQNGAEQAQCVSLQVGFILQLREMHGFTHCFGPASHCESHRKTNPRIPPPRPRIESLRFILNEMIPASAGLRSEDRGA